MCNFPAAFLNSAPFSNIWLFLLGRCFGNTQNATTKIIFVLKIFPICFIWNLTHGRPNDRHGQSRIRDLVLCQVFGESVRVGVIVDDPRGSLFYLLHVHLVHHLQELANVHWCWVQGLIGLRKTRVYVSAGDVHQNLQFHPNNVIASKK